MINLLWYITNNNYNYYIINKGSERVKKTGAEGIRFKESVKVIKDSIIKNYL